MSLSETLGKFAKIAGCFLIILSPLFVMPSVSAREGGGREFTEPTVKKNTSKPAKKKPSVTNWFKSSKDKKETVETKKPAAKKQKAVKKSKKPVRRLTQTSRLEVTANGLPPEGETRFKNNEVLVQFQRNSTEAARNDLVNRLGISHQEVKTFIMSGKTVHRYKLPPGLSVIDAINQLQQSRSVVTAQPNYVYRLQQEADVKKLPQFANKRVSLSVAHGKTKGGNIRIAVIDTAVDETHGEFKNAKLEFFDVTDADTENVNPHGTSIAGILAADVKLTGVAPEAYIVSIAAFSKSKSGKVLGNTWTILEALNIAVEEKANVLNLSFAGPTDPLLKKSFEGAKRRNIIPVAAAGNAGPDSDTLYPAGYDTVIAVTATDNDDNIYAKSNVGEHVDIAAPGVGLLVLSKDSGFRTSSGTSMATAYVSGIVALALSANPGATYDTLRSILDESASDLGAPGKDDIFGQGIPSASKAVGLQ